MKQYNSPEVVFIELENEDVLTTSNVLKGSQGDYYKNDIFYR